MRFENIDGSEQNLFRTLETMKKTSDNALESTAEGFTFPVAEEIRKAPDRDIEVSEGGETISRAEMFKTALHALDQAWNQAIKPHIGKIRSAAVESDRRKDGVDFFTEADLESEKIMRDILFEHLGEDALRIFGEEENAYIGNIESRVGIRIDPIDGTESMKFSKPDWGIMVGLYEGKAESERQVASAVYYPERETLVYGMEETGVFITDLTTAETKKIEPVKDQDELSDVVVHVWRHSDVSQRGNITAIENAIAEDGGRVRSTASACVDVLEALHTGGERILVIDGDYNQVDFIPQPLLRYIGYKIYDWSGSEYDPDDVELTNKKLVVVPPGKAGQRVQEIIRMM